MAATKYHVLRLRADGQGNAGNNQNEVYEIVARAVDASSDLQAIRKIAPEVATPQAYVAIPVRSFRKRNVEVTTQTRLKLT